MVSTPPLLAVSSSLHAAFQALPHVLNLVSSFLLPLTIDSAVYNDLHRAIQRYDGHLPHTVRAMDGAAALGRLDLIQWLHSNRTEGCSNAAFTNAAVNNHINVLEWLYEFYPGVANPAHEIVKAAECGNIQVINFLEPKVRREQVQPALVAAAVNGHVAVLGTLLRRPFNMYASFLAAAGNGQAQVVQFLLEKEYNDRFTFVNPALLKAAEGGHCEIVGLLVDRSDDYTISEAVMAAAAEGCGEVVKFLLERCKLKKVTIAQILEKAAKNDHCHVVKLLLENITRQDEDRGGDNSIRSVESIIDLALLSAVEEGRISVVKLLVDVYSGPISDVLIAAGSNNQLEVLEFILHYCDVQHLKDADYNEGITSTAETAASSRCVDMAKLLVAKCDKLKTGAALSIAVSNEDLEMLRIFLVKSSFVAIQDALVRAAVTNRVGMLEVLLEHSNADTIEKALVRVESLGYSKMSKMLLGKCDPGAYSRIFDSAAGQGLVGLVQLLLDKMHRHSIRCALISAAISGHTEVVKALVDESDSAGITCAFEMAVLRNQMGVVELLRNHCDADSIRFAISAGDADVVRLLRNKRARLERGLSETSKTMER